MFYIKEIEDYIRVSPEYFAMPVNEAISKQLQINYKNKIHKDIGIIIGILDIVSIGEGVIIPGDGAAYYKSTFRILTFVPEMQELIFGEIEEITNFGAFINLGAMKGMIHISQTMDDFVSFSKSNTLVGKNTKRAVKKGDLCLSRIVAVSFKSDEPKIGLTMRQPGLGKLEWIAEDKRKAKLTAEKAARVAESGGKKKKKEEK
jgi:DNA-directed RNA polymerase subunit E'